MPMLFHAAPSSYPLLLHSTVWLLPSPASVGVAAAPESSRALDYVRGQEPQQCVGI